jgi:hypothetical protein
MVSAFLVYDVYFFMHIIILVIVSHDLWWCNVPNATLLNLILLLIAYISIP